MKVKVSKKVAVLRHQLDELKARYERLSAKLIRAIRLGVKNCNIDKLIEERNNVYTDMHLLGKKIENVRQNKPELGDEIIDYNIRV